MTPAAGLLRALLYVVTGVPAFILLWLLLARIVRAVYRFPMPHFMASVIDNPLRRVIQPPEEMALRHGVEPGMKVLEVGPGSGTYTVAAARRVGDEGQVVAIDIEPKMVERVERRAQAEGVTNIEARVADVYDLPFDAETFDAIYLMSVVGEIPKPAMALQEFQRVLSPTGTLAFSELLVDPDYTRSSTLIEMAGKAGLQPTSKSGNLFHYTLVFEKGSQLA